MILFLYFALNHIQKHAMQFSSIINVQTKTTSAIGSIQNHPITHLKSQMNGIRFLHLNQLLIKVRPSAMHCITINQAKHLLQYKMNLRVVFVGPFNCLWILNRRRGFNN